MVRTWTSEHVLAMSPDASSTKRGKALANVSKWSLLGCSEQAVWGECQGSGKRPYRTQIDLSEPAFRCSCPSRKFPCKHGLGLFLLLTEQRDAFSETLPPDWVVEWLDSRSQAATRKRAKRQVAADPAAQVKRMEKRAAKVEAGLVDLGQWLEDIVRQGLAVLPSQSYGFWDQAAARLVDAQAPGLAKRVRGLAGIPHSGEGWPGRLLQALGQLQLLVVSYGRLESLAPALQAEVRSQIGWTQSQEDLLQRAKNGDPLVETISDTWQILGNIVIEDDNLRVQRTWLWGFEVQKTALVLNFAHGRQPLDVSLVPGDRFKGKLIVYPGTGLRRALVASRDETRGDPSVPAGVGIDTALGHYAQALGQNPWLERFPLILSPVSLYPGENGWWLQDNHQRAWPMAHGFRRQWEMVAIGGGHPLTVFGEWDGTTFLPLSFWAERTFYPLGD